MLLSADFLPHGLAVLGRLVGHGLWPDRVAPPDIKDIDWDELVLAACHHRSLALLSQGLKHAGISPPPAIGQELTAVLRQDAKRNLALAAELRRLWQAFDADDLPVIALKGIPLSQSLYGDLARRGAGDIDLLVAPERFWQADALLTRTLGYDLSPEGRVIRERRKSHPFMRDLAYCRGPFLIELHQRLTANPHRLPCDFAELWQRRQDVRLAGVTIPTLPKPELGLYLCVHGTYHCWERLCWLADLAKLADGPEGAMLLRADAIKAGLDRPMGTALALAELILGLPGGAPPAELAKARALGRTLFPANGWITPPERGSREWLRRELARRRLVYGMRRQWRHRKQELAADLFNPIDWKLLPAADTWWRLYPLVRPLGWLKRNFRRR